MKTTTIPFSKGYLGAFAKYALQLILCMIVYTSISFNAKAQTCTDPSYTWLSHRNWFLAPNAQGIIRNMSTGTSTASASDVTAYEGLTSASDDNGNLLFYSNGRKLWVGTTLKNSTDILQGNEGGGMVNGSGSQGIITVRHPLKPDDYYIFTTDDALTGTAYGFNYAVFDASGNVTKPVSRLGAYRTAEGIAATTHANGVDIWITVREGYGGGTNYHTYLLTCDGVTNGTTSAVTTGNGIVSNLASTLQSTQGERGGLAFSQDGTRLAAAFANFWPYGADEVCLYDFNNATGAISNKLSIGTGGLSPYDVIFSPDGSRIYTSEQAGAIYYYTISSGVAATIIASRTTTGAATGYSSMEIGPDGALYYTTGNTSGSLHKLTGNLNSATSFTNSVVAGTASKVSLGLPTMYLPPEEFLDIAPQADLCTTDGPVDLVATFRCLGTSAEDITKYPTAYSGTGIVTAGNGDAIGTFDPSVAGIGNHTITFTRCGKTATIVIKVTACGCTAVSGTPSITGTSTFCAGGSIALTGNVPAGNNGFYYEWRDNGGGVISSGTISTALATTINSPSITAAGNYTFRMANTSANINSASCYKEDVQAVTVKPLPVVTATGTTTICSGTAPSIALTSSVASTTYAWVAPTVTGGITGASAGSGTPIAQTLTNPGTTNGTVTYAVIGTAAGCPGTATNVVITVKPLPTVTGASTSICSGTAPSVALTSNVASTTFAWVAPTVTGGITGASAGSGTPIAQTLTNPGTTNGTVTYAVIGTAAGCSGTATNVVITVKPLPTVTGASTAICSGTAPSVALTSNVASTTFDWVAPTVTGGITGSSAGSGTPIAQTLTNPGTTNGTVTYAVIGTAAGCSGSATNVVITVKPLPTVTGASTSICSGTAPSVALTSNVASTTYAWVAPTVTGGITGASAGSGTPIAQTLTNPGTANGTVTYAVIGTAAGCSGTATNVVITVKPLPTVTGASTAICSGTAPSVALTSNVASTTFDWVAPTVTGGITGSSAGSGTPIAQTLTNPGTTNGTVTYAVIGTAAGCSGSATNVVITVKPLPTVTGASTAICSGTAPSVALTSNVASTTFAWVAPTVTGGITGASAGSGTPIAQTLTNPGTTNGTVTYAVIGTAAGCSGTATNVVITVKPSPDVTASGTTTICSGTAPSIALTSNTAGAAFAWPTPTVTGGITGASAGSGTPIAQTLTNPGATAGTVTYAVTPTANTCSGTPINVVITVNPKPNVTGTGTTICSGTAPSVALTSNVAGATFDWPAPTATGGITGSSAGSGTPIAQTLTNPGTTAGTVTYAVTATANTCSGTAQNVVITVNPAVIITTPPAPATVCAGGNTSFAVVATGAVSYQWYGVTHGMLANGGKYSNVTTASLSLTGATTAEVDDYYVIVTGAAPCASVTSTNAKLTINSVTTINSFTASANPLCEGDALTLTGSVGGTAPFNYTLKLDGTTVDTKTAQPTGSYSYNVSSVTEGTHDGVYTLDVTSACTGNPNSQVTIVINKVVIIDPVATSVCSGTSTTLTVGTTGSVGTLTYNWYKGATKPGTPLTNGAVYSGVHTATLTLNSATSAEEGSYYVEVLSGGSCAKTSNPVAFTLKAGSTITTQPTITTKCVGDAASMSIVVTPAATAYQWYKNNDATLVADGATISGATTATLDISSVKLTDAGTYYVKATTTCGVLTSDKTSILAVNGVDITAQPTDQGTCNNGNVTFSVTATGPGLTYEWQENTGSGFGNMTPSQTTSSLLVDPVLTAMDGYTYQVKILSNGLCPVTSDIVSLSVTNNTSINTQPVGGNYCLGDKLDLSVSGSGTGTPTYKWYFNNVPIPSATNATYSVASIAAANGGDYKVDVTTSCGTATSNTVTVKVNGVTINTQPANNHFCEGSNANFSVAATGLGSLSYQWQVNKNDGAGFNNISSQTSLSYGFTTAISDDNYQYHVIIKDDNACADTSNVATLLVDAKTVITAQPKDTSVCEAAPFSLSVTATTEGAATYVWAPDKRSVGSNSTYSVASTLPSDAGAYSVTIKNAGLCPDVTSNTVTVIVTPTPLDNLPVTALDVCLNSAGAISVASSQNNVTYQAYNGSTPIGTSVSGPGTIGLPIPSSELSPAGVHTFVVKANPGHGCPLVTLVNPAIINVIGAPGAVTGPTIACTNANTGLAYSVTDVATINNPVTYNWNTSGATIASGTGTSSISVDLNATGTSGTITLVSVSTATATCPVNDGLIVKQVLDYYPESLSITEDTICAGNTVIFTINNQNAVGYNWITGAGVTDQSIFVQNPKEFKFDTPGDIHITLQPFHPCRTSITPIDTIIHVIAPPVADAGVDVHLNNLVPFTLDGLGSSTNIPGGDIYKYEWISTDNGAVIQDPKSILTNSTPSVLNSIYTLWVTTTNTASCAISDEMEVIVEPIVKVPNVFSPNHDGNHDVLVIKNIQFFPKSVLYIYNQWGELIYKSKAGYPEPWDGTRDGTECAVSAYYYVLELNQNDYKPMSGDVTIVR